MKMLRLSGPMEGSEPPWSSTSSVAPHIQSTFSWGRGTVGDLSPCRVNTDACTCTRHPLDISESLRASACVSLAYQLEVGGRRRDVSREGRLAVVVEIGVRHRAVRDEERRHEGHHAHRHGLGELD